MNAISQNQQDSIDVATDAAKANYREHHRTVAGLLEVIDMLTVTANDNARRVGEAQQHLNTICHQRDDEAEENKCLRTEVERLTAEIEALRSEVAAFSL